MNYNSIYTQALKDALIEREKANACVNGIIQKLAEGKEERLIRIIKKQNPFSAQGFVPAKVKISETAWRDGFILTAYFLKRDVTIPSSATNAERKLLNEYKNLTKDAAWHNMYNLSRYVDTAESIDHSLRFLKNKIKVVIYCNWEFTGGDLLDDGFLERGFSFIEY